MVWRSPSQWVLSHPREPLIGQQSPSAVTFPEADGDPPAICDAVVLPLIGLHSS